MGLQSTGWMHNCERHGNPVLQANTRALGKLGQDISRAMTDDCFPNNDPNGDQEYTGGRDFNGQYQGQSIIPFIANSIRNAQNPAGQIIDLKEEIGHAVPGTAGRVVDYREPDPIAPLPDGGRT